MRFADFVSKCACGICAASILAVSCRTEIYEPEPQPEKPYLQVGTRDLSFAATGGTLKVDVTANRRVVVNVSDKWIADKLTLVSDQPASGSSPAYTYQLEVTVLPDQNGRKGFLTVSAPDCADVTIGVTQLLPDKPLSSTCNLKSFSLRAEANGLESDLSFKLASETMTWSAKYLKWIERKEPEMMVPTFVTDGSMVLVDGTEIVSGVTELSFADDFTVVVVAENGDTKEYTVSLNCPQINRELPVLHIRPDHRITSDKNTYTDTYIEFYDKTPDSKGTGWWDSATQGKIQMRRRGNSTWELPKKPFRMKFPEKVSPIGLDHCSEKSWALVANDMDKSLLRNYIAFEYSRIMFVKHQGYHDSKALKFTPVAQPINVYYTGDYYYSDSRQTRHLDGEYFGVYQFSDQMNKGDGRIDVDKLTAADTDPAMITGGYIVEFDIHEGNHNSSRGVRMTYKYPEDDNFDWSQYQYITDFINRAESALYSSNYKDPVNGWRRWFDEKTLADYIIIKELVGDMDGYTSTYLYKRRGVDKLFFGPIWDCDKGWDNDRRAPHGNPLSQLMIDAGFWINSGMDYDWYHRFWDDETFRAFVNNRWKEKKEELLAKTWEILDEMPKKMSKAIEANFSVWDYYYQYSSEAKMPASTYAGEIERIRRLTRERATLLDRLFAE